jgi:lipopolysaccharide/colanic/teichoic acid biosynthesis glycosyltransferase
LFRQQRVGHGGRLFTLYKFRTMHSDADHDLPARPNDERITRVGRWLRRTRLDELPQLYNILRGDMDLIGPRPFIPAVEEHCARQIPFYCQRWNLRPGITGWAQVHNGYCTTLEENIEKLGYDLFYIKHMSVGLDLLILFRTTKILLLGRGAR